MEILKWLEGQAWISSYEIQDFRQLKRSQYFRLKITFINQTVLFVREYVDERERSYAFHWQDQHDEMIARWDNAPHHPSISTFPHHKHLSDEILENRNITLADVLEEIRVQIATSHEE